MNFEDWISVDEELPPCDGQYAVCKIKFIPTKLHHAILNQNTAQYDGFYFIMENDYFDITHWKSRKQPKKRYGKKENWGNEE